MDVTYIHARKGPETKKVSRFTGGTLLSSIKLFSRYFLGALAIGFGIFRITLS